MPTAMLRLVRDNKTSTSSGRSAKIVGENYQPEVRVCLSQTLRNGLAFAMFSSVS